MQAVSEDEEGGHARDSKRDSKRNSKRNSSSGNEEPWFMRKAKRDSMARAAKLQQPGVKFAPMAAAAPPVPKQPKVRESVGELSEKSIVHERLGAKKTGIKFNIDESAKDEHNERASVGELGEKSIVHDRLKTFQTLQST